MPKPTGLDTERVRLQQWHDDDVDPFAAINADTRAMRFFPSGSSRDVTAATIRRWQAQIADRGWGRGFAMEAACGVLAVGVERPGIDEIVSHQSPEAAVAMSRR